MMSIDEILDKHLQDIRAGHDSKLKAELLQLIEQKCIEARVDELKNLRAYYAQKTGMTGYLDIRMDLDDSIAELTNKKKGDENG